jgi:ATP-dependent Clp protease ATP-binding subunit ClpA
MSGAAQALSLKFSNRIIGQPKGTQALTRVLEKFQSGFYNTTKPIGSLLFLGPTGVGKTGAVEAFCEGLFGDPRAMLKVDCGEFQHSHEIAKLVGSPPGYLGHRETHPYFTQEALNAWFTEKLKLTVILFDEIEKASDSLWNLLLGILDKATLTLGDNRKIDFTRCVIIMTSNVGAAELAVKIGDKGLGFLPVGTEVSQQEIEDTAISAARRKFMPEFLNRIDDVVVFNTLTKGDVEEILGLELQKLQDRVVVGSQQLFTINVSPSAIRQIIKEGYSKRDNARYLQRTVEKYISSPLASLLATGQIMPHDTVIVDHIMGEWGYYAQGNGDILFP